MRCLGWSRGRFALLGVVVAVVGVLVVVLAGSSAASVATVKHSTSRVSALGRPGFAPSAKELGASSLRTPHADRSDLPVKAGAKLPWLSRADSNTFMAGSGRLVTRIYPTVVNYRKASGSFAAISSKLVSSASGYQQQANDLGVVLPRSAAGQVRVSGSGGGLTFGLLSSSGLGKVSGSTEQFRDALSGVDLAYSSQNSGIGWQASLSAAAASRGLSWRVSPSSGLTAKLVSGGVAFRNATGKTVWLFTAPTARTAVSGKPTPVKLSLRRSAQGVVIHIAAATGSEAAVSRSASQQFATFNLGTAGVMLPAAVPNPSPVIWSGQVIPGSFVYPGAAQQTGDCYIDSGTPNTSFCLAGTNYVGPDDHTLVNFDVADNVPSHVQILQSYLSMTLTSQSNDTAESVGVWQAAQPWTNLATWNTYDGSDDWTTPGGDTTGSMEDDRTIGASGDTGNSFLWDVNSSMQGWVDGNPPQVEGLLVAPTAGAGAPNTLGFGTETSTDESAYLSVYYAPRLGDYPGAKYDTQQLTDRSSDGTNVATGNLLLSNQDINLAGVNGLNLSIGRYYNNLSTDQDSFGVGWSMGTGADTYLTIPFDENNVVDFFDGTGNAQMFYTNSSGTFVSPAGEDAQLTMNAGDTYNATQFTLLFRHSGLTETFTAAAGYEKVARLSTLSDRNGNTIHYDYNGSGQLTSIVDSYGATTTLSWSPDGYVDEITDPTGREYKYYQNGSGQLTEYKDPAGDSTYYTYDAYGNLTQIKTPDGNITNVAYDAGNTNEVTSVTRLVTPTDSSGPQTTYQIATASGTCPANNGWTQDTVSDPNRHVSTYCTDGLSRITQSVDPNGHMRSTSYSPDGFVEETQTGLGTPTTFTYSGDDNDNVTEIQQGTTGGSPSPLTTHLGYTDASNQYLPTTAEDAQSNSVDYTYDSHGNETQAKEPTTGDNTTMTYNTDGTVATSTDANGHETTYGYTAHNLTTVTPPSGSGLNPIHLSYDSANRVAEISTVSGATGHEVDYTYDDFDRITQSVYKNAAGTTEATIGYSYDNDGNLLSRTDSSGTTSYVYDGLNRLTSETPPDGQTDTYTYDPASNLTELTDWGGAVSYEYDKANQLTSIFDPGASKPFAALAYDADGNLLSTTYTSGASDVNTYNSLDQLTKTTDTYKTTGGSVAHLSYAYTFAGGLQHTMTDQAGNVSTYSYDALNRLTEAKTQSSGGTTTADYQYTLDPAGNIDKLAISGSAVTASTTSYAYNSGNQTCWSYTGSSTNTCGSPPSGAHSYTYDADGNQTSNGNGLTATYNTLGQTTSITSGGTATDYSYLGEGQDELVAEGSATLHNDLLGLGSEANGSGSTYYTRMTNGAVIQERTPTASYNYLYDGNGNVVGLTDSSAHLVNQYAYDPYGNKTTNTTTVANPFGFGAGYTTVSGLSHFGARYQNPTDGRWTQQDPLNQITSLTQANRYAYAGDNPINFGDRSGDTIKARAAVCYATLSLLGCRISDDSATANIVNPIPTKNVPSLFESGPFGGPLAGNTPEGQDNPDGAGPDGFEGAGDEGDEIAKLAHTKRSHQHKAQLPHQHKAQLSHQDTGA
jgi:RHS repeat-associated protein